VLIGYARVSTTDQHLALQTDALKRAGCELPFTDTLSGAKTERAGLAQALSHLRALVPRGTAVTRGVCDRAPIPRRDAERHPALQRRHPRALMHTTISERCGWGAE
jgi:hypothetical protein